MTGFLSAAELVELTGYKRPGQQSDWLTASGIRHHRNRLGRVVVLWADVSGDRRRVESAQPMRFSFERG